jgi:dethiobiotin synthetase
MSQAYFLTGTDTEIGKTLMACSLLHAAAAQGMRTLGMKPVAAGGSEDVDAMVAASGVAAPREYVNPYLLREPVAPHIAARHDGVAIDLGRIVRCFGELYPLADFLIVEGVGGFCVPFDESHDSADLAVRLGLPVVLVVGLRLGCINHTLLTAEAVRARGLHLAGWIANQVDSKMAFVDENIATLHARLGAPLLGTVPFLATPDAGRVAGMLTLPDKMRHSTLLD